MDYGNIIFDKPNNESFKSRTESIQYKVCVAITGAIQGSSRGHLHRELGLDFNWQILVSKTYVLL